MTCREATEFLTEYVSGTLPPDVLVAFERHLSRCANCSAFLEQFREAISAGQIAFAGDDADAGTAMPDELLRSILAAVAKPQP